MHILHGKNSGKNSGKKKKNYFTFSKKKKKSSYLLNDPHIYPLVIVERLGKYMHTQGIYIVDRT